MATEFVKWSKDGLWSLKDLLAILKGVSDYAEKHDCENVRFLEIGDNSDMDPNDRFDIEIVYTRGEKLFTQKLLLLNGEIVDGKEFHKRYAEFYPV